jgi:hypothetical protein
MRQSLKHFLLYGSMIALMGATACSTMEASIAGESTDGNTASQASGDLYDRLAADSQGA